ncbi:glycosyltransferase [Ekhidna sp.]|uniref:glycosyltransferase n=1 Tax=Ekhidna sp. TaxID=2608089 RepID=UPI0032974D03
MMILIAAFTILHVLFYLKLAHGWIRIPLISSKETLIPFSVVIPVRNEEENIARILHQLAKQNYPKDLFEVIVVDDFSDDQTVSIVNGLKDSLEISIRLIPLIDKQKQGKKHALTAAINAAEHETILTTDADCWFEYNWIKCYNDAFDERTNMVAGPVAIQGKGIFARLQQVEFAGLMGFGAVTISHENPSMCSGANLGFRKSAFEAVGGYTNNLFTPSGDDEFLLFNIMSKFPHSTRFLKSDNAVVKTAAHKKLRSFVNQRTRWTSKWKYNKNWKVRVSAILFFLDYLIFYASIAFSLLGLIDPILIALVILVRFISMLLFVAPINKFLKGRSSFWPLLVFQIIYPLHVLFMGMNSIFGSYTWKGRKYG